MGRILVAMSGGVDSAAAALLLRQQGRYSEIAGATFRLWRNGGTDNSDDIRDAKTVCDQLGMRHYVLEFTDIFREEVIAPFVKAYEAGETPNPCVLCNRGIKFGAFLRAARELGFDKIATGHYARVERENGRFRLRRALHLRKDQSYFLYRLSQEQLAAAELPLGDYSKEEARALATREGLAVSGKSDSQDICFLPSGDYGAFLDQYLNNPAIPGDFLNEDGAVIGTHPGVRFYTIGQRKGLGGGFPQPVYVKSIDAGQNTVTLSDNEALYSDRLTACDLNWIDYGRPPGRISAAVKIRNAHQPADAVVTLLGERAQVKFARPQRAITPGQSVVFYAGEYVVGGGRIVSDQIGQNESGGD